MLVPAVDATTPVRVCTQCLKGEVPAGEKRFEDIVVEVSHEYRPGDRVNLVTADGRVVQSRIPDNLRARDSFKVRVFCHDAGIDMRGRFLVLEVEHPLDMRAGQVVSLELRSGMVVHAQIPESSTPGGFFTIRVPAPHGYRQQYRLTTVRGTQTRRVERVPTSRVELVAVGGASATPPQGEGVVVRLADATAGASAAKQAAAAATRAAAVAAAAVDANATLLADAMKRRAHARARQELHGEHLAFISERRSRRRSIKERQGRFARRGFGSTAVRRTAAMC